MSTYYFSTEHGDVKFNASGTPSQCGMTFIHDVIFKSVKDKQKLYEYFLNTIIFGKDNLESNPKEPSGWGFSTIERSNGHWNVNKYLMTDYKRNHKNSSLYDFCKTMGALEGDLVPNPNSGNKVRSFEFSRKSINEDGLDARLEKLRVEAAERRKVLLGKRATQSTT